MPSLSRVMCCSSLSLMLLGAGSVDAQSGVVLRGTVMDPAGSAVSGIVLQLTRAGQPVEDAISSAGGVFRFKAVPPGNYGLVTPAFQGLAAREIPVAISASNPPLAIVLTPATVVETIQVDGGKTLSTAAADNKDTVTVSGDALGNLPVFDQDPISTLLPFLDPSSTASGGVSIIVDGVELKGLTVTPSAIAEMRINSDPYSAEYATPGRGRIEITTKPGSPLYHGTFNFIFRDSDLNARNYFAPTRAPEQRRIYEGNFSGPVGHGGHTTLLVSATRREEDLQSAVHAVGPPGQFGFDALGNLFENVSTPSRHTQANGHVTHDFSDQHRLNAGYNYDELARKNRNVGGTVLPEAAYNNDSRGKIFTGQMQYTLSRSYDNTDGLSFFPQNQYAPGDEWGRSTFDRLQRFNILASIYPGRWLNLGFASGLSSGAPYNELAGSDFFTTGLGNARPAGIGRNTLQGSGNINVDLSWNHDLPLTPRRNRLSAKDRNILNFGVSAFNILNHSDFWATSYVGNIRSPLFRHPTTAFAPRQMQFQLRYQF